MTADISKSIVYTGTSMNPTFKPLDILQVIPYDNRKIQPGDVIVFLPPGRKRKVIHRVIFIDAKGIRTRGDRNMDIDPWVLSPDDIIGRVVWAQRKKRQRTIFGGLKGQLYLLRIRPIRIIDSKVSSLLRPIYRRLARTGAIRRCLPDWMKPRLLSFHRSGGTELQLLIGQRVIGQLLPGKKQWQIRRPFRLFVNEAALPQPKGKTLSS